VNPTGEAALRFRAPQEGQTVIEDLIKGRVVFDNAVLDDLIILRSNGYPTYNFSVVVDDALMGITHVVRGDDHLTNTPRQVPIFHALGFQVPEFGHLSMILGSDKARLSKRHGATSVLAYRDMGYLPEAIINYLVRLGWSYGDQEVFSLQEMIEKFSFDNVQKSSAVFNLDKLLWLNAHYIKQTDPKHVAERVWPFLERAGVGIEAAEKSSEWMERLVLAFRERAQTLEDIAKAAIPYLQSEIQMDEAAATKFLTPAIAPLLARLADRFAAVPDFDKETLEAVFKNLIAEAGVKMGELAQPVRVALTGRTASPGLFEVIDLLGRDRTLERLRRAVSRARRLD
jgi:glutamyl-tRNA synthetase